MDRDAINESFNETVSKVTDTLNHQAGNSSHQADPEGPVPVVPTEQPRGVVSGALS